MTNTDGEATALSHLRQAREARAEAELYKARGALTQAKHCFDLAQWHIDCAMRAA